MMKDLKIPFFTVLFIFIGLIVYSKVVGSTPLTNNGNTKTNVFHVQGEGKATAIPDTVTVTVGVTQDASEVIQAQSKVNQTTNKIIADLKKLGINEKNIKTQNYSVNPKYNYTSMGNKPDGYTVSQEIEIESKLIEKINKVIDLATIDGANIINGTNFTFSDELQKKLENQAREDAVKDAKQKAETLSKAAGMNLGKVVDITESNDRVYPIPMMKTQEGIAGTTQASVPPTQVTPGENTVNITVNITYEVR
ncbi:MAG: hypothetical protein CO135_03135 [Candidatus Levybacteria bacterium CG_4_9_14_3_um_filter_35_16]|nr:MAG: hypothetical protein COW87_01440 [Candidatus Levybacteria bacterium CG22_combo_CG10-13_8_21_14_all_35_11]PIZ98812.1 MAG: hypothetical protein COX78_02705 [Candidatus Levybacteria bacterium CG_4_10_14_0_2_um_filter_35_8]PJA91067.1 MAG: hypothetical protein CO135_03135 [Candidatus Levybacteria bacterium CG_4_9_14_3_um_filter_35_16]PJC54263.1 MAG: hypothetical protein CO028_03330 [Candidatus Levybacteria bacterium CG_4_9_14_0_2_um_filter_35_21]